MALSFIWGQTCGHGLKNVINGFLRVMITAEYSSKIFLKDTILSKG
jgi:hypothetical protein